MLIEPLTEGENGSYPLLRSGDALEVISRVVKDGQYEHRPFGRRVPFDRQR